MTDLAKLNRLRVNAGKTELKSWKASKDALTQAISGLEAAGHTDALPGANVNATPVLPENDTELSSLANPENAMSKTVANETPAEPKKKPKASLARGLDTDQMARQSRYAVQSQREQERKEKQEERAKVKSDKKKKPAEPAPKDEPKKKLTKAEKKALKKKIKLSKKEKRAIREEAESRIAGAVDPKVDPEKAKRQKKHVEDKQKARAEKPKKDKSDSNEVTVAELCRELNIEPKVGRAKLRRHEDKLVKLHTKGQDRWTFPKSAAAEIKAILKPK